MEEVGKQEDWKVGKLYFVEIMTSDIMLMQEELNLKNWKIS